MNRPAQDIRFCTSRDGTRIAFAVNGKGPPLVRAGHSFSHLEYEWDCGAWRPLLDLLCEQRTLVRYDMRGTGLSDRDGVEFSFDRYVEDLEAVVAATNLRQFDLFGMTGGGALAVNYAVRHPQRVSHLVLLGAYLQGRMTRSRTKEQREETSLVLRLIELGWGQDNPTFQQLFTYQFFPDGSAEQFQEFNDLMRRSASAPQAAALLRAWFDADVSQLAPQVRTPTLVVHAHGDLRIPYDQGRALAACIPGARLVSLDSRNHILLEHEAAWPLLAAEFNAFLTSAGPAGEAIANSLDGLTTKERAVLEVLRLGLGTPEMASRLGVSEKTLRNHLSTIYSKLGVSGRAQAMALSGDGPQAPRPRG
jgi:pimeloyl-ACP methyl ester carboxylesterase/DNA-binding CsgD family transcriptional regulator